MGMEVKWDLGQGVWMVETNRFRRFSPPPLLVGSSKGGKVGRKREGIGLLSIRVFGGGVQDVG